MTNSELIDSLQPGRPGALKAGSDGTVIDGHHRVKILRDRGFDVDSLTRGVMRAELSWIEAPWQGRLAILPRPRGGDWLEDEVREWRLAGVDVVVSLLTSDEIAELDLVEEARLAHENGIQYLAFPITDRSVPASRRATLEFATTLESLLQAGKTVAVHCRQGIGRSALIAACVLILAGIAPEAVFRRLSAARGRPVPETAEQRQWVIQFARELTPASA